MTRDMHPNDEIAAIDAQIVKLSIFSIPGPLLIGGALLGKYGEPDEIPFEFLTNTLLTNVMLGAGICIFVVTMGFVVKLGIAKANAQMAQEAERSNTKRK